jgi:hypothetical protein
MLNGIEDDEIQDTRDFNPFHYRRRGNYTIGRSIDASSSLFGMINQIFDSSRNAPSQNNENLQNPNYEIIEDDPIIEEITFHVTYPMNMIDSTNLSNTNLYANANANVNRTNQYNLNSINNTINSMVSNSIRAFDSSSNNLNLFSTYRNNIPVGTTTRSYNNILNPFDNFSNGSLFQQILTQSLYDESAYKKKISEKGKAQLTHIKFDKNNTENMNTSCPIMQTDFEEDQYLIQLPCNHLFIPDAINRWLDEKPECPVCRFELDSIEVKREFNNDINYPNNQNNTNRRPYFTQSRSVHPSTIMPNDNLRYLNHYRDRQVGRDRIQLTENSYLDYLYEEIDNNDFQRALVLSYQELVDSSNGNQSTNISDSYSNLVDSSSNDSTETDETNTVNMMNALSSYIDNVQEALSEPESEITEPSHHSEMSEEESQNSETSSTSYCEDHDY